MKMKEVKREIVTAMVGTAGHVDHGKTTLVGMLTGCDTDGLQEEKTRGLSINLGFAPCVLPGRRMIGIVDVPGHRDFIRNMVAGAASIDVLMLVTAADDGVMPQTAEHMQIIRLLRKPQIMVVLTKIDLVDEETVELAIDDVATYMAKIGYPDVPIIPASSVTGDGLMAVREKLYELVDRAGEREPDRRRFRMNVERTFSVEGYGTVATGIPISGKAPVGDKLVLMPSGKTTSVRAVQVYKTDAEAALAGACAAINLRDLGPDDLTRGMTLVIPDTYQSVTEFVATLESVAIDRALKRRFEAKIHAGTSVGDATVRLIDVESLAPGATGLAHVKVQEPLTVTAGDRFVIRSLSPMTTVAGGSILSVNPGKMKRSSPHLLPRLIAAREAVDAGAPLAAELLAGGPVLFRMTDLVPLSRMDPADAQAQIARLIEDEMLEDLGGGSYLVAPRLPELTDRMAGELSRYHEAHAYTWGMTSSHVCEVLDIPVKSFKGITRALRRDERITVRHGHLARAGFEPPLSAKQMEQKDAILADLAKRAEAGGRPPAMGDLAQRLKIASADMKLLVRMLTDEDLVRVVGSNLLSRETYEENRRALLGLFETRDEVGLAEFREATGLGRNLAWTLLEAFDVEGMTKKMGDVRVRVRGADAARGGDDA